MIVCGIDPGHSGAIAFIDTVKRNISIFDMPVKTETKTKTRREVAAPLLARIIRRNQPTTAYLEEVWSSKEQQSTNAFTFGDGYGTIKGCLAALDVPLNKVRPQTWKKTTRCPKDKNEARFRAMELIPVITDVISRAKDDGRAEAALIALYGCFDQGVIFDGPLKFAGLNDD